MLDGYPQPAFSFADWPGKPVNLDLWHLPGLFWLAEVPYTTEQSPQPAAPVETFAAPLGFASRSEAGAPARSGQEYWNGCLELFLHL